MNDETSPDARLDQPSPVRAGETLEVSAIARYLRVQGIGASDAVRVEQFPRGFSNLTYLITAGDRSWILRRPPVGVGRRAGVAHDVVREARLLESLGAAYPRVPRIVTICEDAAIIGAPFYLMERAVGIILRDRLPPGLTLGAPAMRRVSESVIDTLAEIHTIDFRAAGLGELGHPDGYAQRQVEGWTRRYQAARTGEQPALESLADWLATAVPSTGRTALLHNDFKYDNIVLDPDDPARIVAVLDWEMATIGDPLMDLGTALAYWVEAGDPPALQSLGLGVTALPGNLSREEVLARYAESTGHVVDAPVFYYAYGLFKVGVIAQQIYSRFVRGLTRDPRFAILDGAVTALGEAGVRAIERGHIGSRA